MRSPKEFFYKSSLASITESTVKATQPEKDYEYILHTLLRYQKFTKIRLQSTASICVTNSEVARKGFG